MENKFVDFIKLAIRQRLGDPASFKIFKKEYYSRYRMAQPTNADIRETYNELVATGRIKKSPGFEKALLARAIRTESGVAVVAVLTKPYACPGKCLYCPTEKAMPKSYLSNEPAVMRAIANKFNPYAQVQSRLKVLELNGHQTDKVELIIMGGTFSYFPKSYQEWFIKECFRACNDFGSYKAPKVRKFLKSDLGDEQKRNETAKHRIVGLTLETRPDYINEKEVLNFRELGCTRVELGVQSIFDDVLKKNRRGHLIAKTIRATKLLKDAGFKINYHIMPGLPGSSPARDLRMFRELFSNPGFQPDMLKIYPTVVLRDSALYRIWKDKQYRATSDRQFEKFILEVKNGIIPPYVRIQRIIRDVPAVSILAGPKLTNLRQLIAHRSQCPCIRCREVRSEYQIKERIVLNRIEYLASDGKEIFLQFVSPDKTKLFALLRLRLPSDDNRNHFIPGLRDAALIREVHTYGKMAEIDQRTKGSPQHIGLGKKLMLEAEKIARKEGFRKIVVISGVGVRGYYRKLGYRQKDTYMLKNI